MKVMATAAGNSWFRTAAGKRFCNFNREQQGQIAQDYYNLVINPHLSPDDPVRLAYQPFIEDLRSGEL